MVVLPTLMMQKNRIQQTVFWFLTLSFFKLSVVECLNCVPSIFMLVLCNPSPKMKKGRIENNEIKIISTNLVVIRIETTQL